MTVRAALVGCGQLGGSLVVALRAAGAVQSVVGFDREPAHAERARALGLVDQVAPSAAAAVAGADLVLLAVPVRATRALWQELAPELAGARLITDVGSTKLEVVAEAERLLPAGTPFCGSHPLSGSERSGPEAADARLFVGRPALLTPTAQTPSEALAACEALWRAVGARPVRLSPRQHDRAMAWVSHLPHAAAFALAAALEGVADEVNGLWGGGFADTTRIAASDPAMWRDIFLSNREALLGSLEGLMGQLRCLHQAVEAEDGAAIEALVRRAGATRRRIMESQA